MGAEHVCVCGKWLCWVRDRFGLSLYFSGLFLLRRFGGLLWVWGMWGLVSLWFVLCRFIGVRSGCV